MSNEQKPSIECVQRYRLIGHDSDLETDPDGDLVKHAELPDLLARVRREARAEAFEEAAKRADRLSEHDAEILALEDAAPHHKQIRVHRRVRIRREVANEIRALAAKERAS